MVDEKELTLKEKEDELTRALVPQFKMYLKATRVFVEAFNKITPEEMARIYAKSILLKAKDMKELMDFIDNMTKEKGDE